MAVRPVRASALASSWVKNFGFLQIKSDFSHTYSAYVPSCPASKTPKTSSPKVKSSTPSPISITTPEKSLPDICGILSSLAPA